MDGWVLFRLSANFVFVLPVGFKICFLYLWRMNSNEELWEMGNAKQCNLKELVTVTQFAREAENVGDRAIYSRVPGCCERKWAADRAVTDHGDLTVKIRNRWTEKLRTKMHFHRGKGICRSSGRKWMRWCPRRLRVPSLNKIAQTAVRPSPLWEFRTGNCFRDFIVAWQNENLRWSGLSYLSRVTGIQRSVAKGFCVSAFCPLECKRIRLASLRWFSDEANY